MTGTDFSAAQTEQERERQFERMRLTQKAIRAEEESLQAQQEEIQQKQERAQIQAQKSMRTKLNIEIAKAYAEKLQKLRQRQDIVDEAFNILATRQKIAEEEARLQATQNIIDEANLILNLRAEQNDVENLIKQTEEFPGSHASLKFRSPQPKTFAAQIWNIVTKPFKAIWNFGSNAVSSFAALFKRTPKSDEPSSSSVTEVVIKNASESVEPVAQPKAQSRGILAWVYDSTIGRGAHKANTEHALGQESTIKVDGTPETELGNNNRLSF